MEAALHVNNASGLTFNHAVREAPPETRSSEGGGVWAEYVPTVALKSTLLLLMTSMCLYRSGWGAVATAQASPLDRSRKFIWVDSHRDVLHASNYNTACQLSELPARQKCRRSISNRDTRH